MNIADLFFERSVITPDKRAVWCDGKTITYKGLAQLVRKYSYFLSSSGVAYRDHIGFPMNNSIESVVMMFATANIGAALVPINPTLPFAAVKEAFSVSNVKHIIARQAFLESFKGKIGELITQGAVICIDGTHEDALSMNDAIEPPIGYNGDSRVTGDETWIVCLTSGSTGKPKPIDLTQNNKHHRAIAHINLYDLTENDIILAATPLYHSLAERLVIMPLVLGGTSIIMPHFTPNLWLKCVREQEVTFTIAVSAQLSQIAELLSSPFAPHLPSLRSIVSSSALLEPHIRNELIQKLDCQFHEMYGTSEISTATNIHYQENPEKKNSIGKPLPIADIRINLPNQQLAKPLEVGEISCKTQLICNGYLGMDSLFSEQIEDGYFKTGDLGYMDDDGFLYFTGRIKELIITGGINVYPQDIEQCISALPEVLECAAFAYPDERLVEVVALAVVVKPDCKLTKRTVKVQCARNLADFQQPHKIFFLNELPKNAMGKIIKTKLLEFIRREGLDETV